MPQYISAALKAALLPIIIFQLLSCKENIKESALSNTNNANNANSIEEKVLSTREHDFNFDWKFALTTDKNAFKLGYDDSQWRSLRLPHDWSIESPYIKDNKTHGATAYLPGGQGWYRKHFASPDHNKITHILFDGIYNHSKVWINGHLLGERPFGYVPFYYDLTPYLSKDGSKNTLAVYVDRSRYIDSRWYPGSGIYRNVRLITTHKTHIPIWGSFVTTPQVNTREATVNIETQISNQNDFKQALTVTSIIYDNTDRYIGRIKNTINVDKNSTTEINQTIKVPTPLLWDIAKPNFYYAQTNIEHKGQILDKTKTRFGIRHFSYDANKGFSINGRNTKIKGVCIHSDGGLVGTAVPKEVWRRRLAKLQEAGVNAIRTAHNPPSKEFLDLTDEMGILVQNEAFDEWDNAKDKRKNYEERGIRDYITESYRLHFDKWAEKDIKAFVMRDRNHPSVFQWSIGNEIEWTYPRYKASAGYWDKDKPEDISYYWTEPLLTPEQVKQRFKSIPVKGAELAKTANNLAKWVREIDNTRAVTGNMVIPTVSQFSGYADALDVLGYSYRQSVYKLHHKQYPNKMILGAENWVQWHEWKAILEKDYIAGIFLWTGINYLGEASGRWPTKASGSGMLDLAGYPRPRYSMMKALWNDSPSIGIFTQTIEKSGYRLKHNRLIEKEKGKWKKRTWGWPRLNNHWNYAKDSLITVQVLTNIEEVELFLNGTSMGKQTLSNNEDHILKWAIPFTEGTLIAKGIMNGQIVEQKLVTAGAPSAVQLVSDKRTLNADGYDVSHVTAQIVDKYGTPIKHVEQELEFIIEGNVTILGVDNGSSSNIQPHKSTSITTKNGRALLIIQSNLSASKAHISAKTQSFNSNTININIE